MRPSSRKDPEDLIQRAKAAANYDLPDTTRNFSSVPTIPFQKTSLGIIDLCDSDDDELFSTLQPVFTPSKRRVSSSILPVKEEECNNDSDSDDSINLLD